MTSKKIVTSGIITTSLITAGVGLWLLKLKKSRAKESGNLAEAKFLDLLMTEETIDVNFWAGWMVKAGMARDLRAAKRAMRTVIADTTAEKPE